MNQDNQELARLRAAFAASPEDAANCESCPLPETILSAVQGDLPPGELREVVEHTCLCAACAEDWRLAAEVDRQSTASQTTMAPARVGKVIPGRFGQWRPLVAAAALAAGLLIAVGVYRTGGLGPQEPTYREAPGTTVSSLLAEGQALPRQEAVLRWSPVPGASSYDVRVSTEDLQVVDTAQGQTTTEHRIPASALSRLPAGTKLLWQVEAVFPDGTRQSSPTFTNPLQ
jgi:hypothetical protein